MRSLFLVLVILGANPLFSDSLRVFVQRLESSKKDEKLSHALEEAIVLELGNRENINVISSSEVDNIISYSETGSAIGCEKSKKCIVELQKQLKSDIMITGTVGTLDKKTKVLSLTVIDMISSSVKKRTAVMGSDLTELKIQISDALETLIGHGKKSSEFVLLNKDEKIMLAVMPLEPKGVSSETAGALTQVMNSVLNQIHNIDVISQSDIAAMLEKTAVDSSISCTDSIKCMVEIGASFGAGILVTGTVGRIEKTFVISLQLIDTRNATVLKRSLETFNGKAEELKRAVKLAAFSLVGVDLSDKKGAIECTFNTDEAEVLFGTLKEKMTTSVFARNNVLPGRYTLRVIADSDDYYPFQTDLYVIPDIKTMHKFSIAQKPTPWYKTWWFWSSVGIIVTATTATTIYLIQQETPPGGGSFRPEENSSL